MAQSNSEPTGSLENQLRSMILNNVTIGPSNAQQPSQPPRLPRAQYQNVRGRGQYRGNDANQAGHASHRGGHEHRGGGRGRGRGNPGSKPVQYQQDQAPYAAPQVLQRPKNDVQPPNHQSPPNGPPRGHSGFQEWRAKARHSKFVPLNPRPMPAADMIKSQTFFLDNLAGQVLPQVEIHSEELRKKEAFRTELEQICREVVAKHCPDHEVDASLVAFGSISSGFATCGSDMDLSYMASADTPGFFRYMEKELLDRGVGAHLLVKTRVPIIKICQSPTPELLSALREERQKWDDMTPEERIRHDTDAKPEVEASEEPKVDINVDGDHATEETNNGPSASRDAVTDTKRSVDGDVVDAKSPPGAKTKTRGQKKRNSSNATATTTDTTTKPAHGPRNQATLDKPAVVNGDVLPNEKQESAESKQEPAESSSAPTDARKPHPPPRPRKPWYREKRLGPLDFPKTGVGIQCDINQANPLGIHNTTLLRCYSHCDTRVRAMILFVKAWASARKINSSRNGTLSSYGYVLMVLHFLLNVAAPPVCPNLQHARKAEGDWKGPDPRDPNAMCEGQDVRFWRNEAEIQALAAKGFLTHNRQPLGLLLRNFFGYYAQHDGFVWMKQVLSLRTPGGILSKEAKGWTGAKTTMQEKIEVKNRYLFAIEDPFELEHNVARTVTHNGIVAIRDEFRRAWRLLQGVGQGRTDVEDLMMPSDSVQPPLELEAEKQEEGKLMGEVVVEDAAPNDEKVIEAVNALGAHVVQDPA